MLRQHVRNHPGNSVLHDRTAAWCSCNSEEAAITAKSAEATDQTLLDWLRDAHAMEKHAEQMLSNTASRLENYPQLRAQIERHLEETRSQAERLKTCIERHGDSTSTFKDTAAQVMGFGQALTGVFTSDEVVKASAASYAFEHMEMATYKVLITAAEAAGDLTTKEVCEQILAEEEKMAGWLDENLAGVTRTFLAERQKGLLRSADRHGRSLT